MILSMLWLGHAAQKSLTIWTFAFSPADISAALARPGMPAIAASPSPAAVKAERRVKASECEALFDFMVRSFRNECQCIRSQCEERFRGISFESTSLIAARHRHRADRFGSCAAVGSR